MGRRRALLVATYEYEDTGLRQLVSPAQDAEALAVVLEDPAIAGYEVQVLINEPSSRVGEAIDEFYATAERDDLTLLYFSGHGLKDDSGRLYLAMKNTKRERLRFTALPAHMVDEAVNECVARQKLLILDCCYGGAYAVQQLAKADTAVDTKAELGGRGRIVLTATESTQYAFEGAKVHGQASQSVFTRCIVEGLRSGAADLNADGDITADELYQYTYDAVVAEQPNQRPKQIADVQGRTVIAANPHWELPPRIITDLESPAHRDAALQQLGQLLEATNDRVRRTARAKLVELLDNDSRAIADTARAYLDRPPVRAQPVVAPVSPVRRPTGPTFGAAARAAARRWRHRVNLLRGPAATVRNATSSWWLVGLLTLAAGLAIWAAALGATPYTIGVAAVLTIAVAVQFRAVDTAFAAGLLAPGVLSAAIVAGDLTKQTYLGIHDPLPRELFTAAHAIWLATAVVGLLKWRPPKPGLRFSQLIPAAIAAALVLVAVVERYRSLHEYNTLPHLTYPAFLGLIAAEFALIGPLLDFGRAFTIGWVVGGFAIWLGLFGTPRGLGDPWTVVAALLAIWLLIGVLVVTRSRPGAPIRRLVMMAPLLAPVVLGAVAFAVVPPAPRSPTVVAVAVSPDDRTLYATDFANGRLLKFDTTTREQIGDALPVGRAPGRFLLAPDGKTLYVANSTSDSISVIDVAAWKVVGTPIAVAPQPVDLSLSLAAHRLYVLSRTSETITEIDTKTRQTVGGPLASGSSPSDLEVDAKGEWLYVAHRDAGTVSVIDTATRQPARSPIKVVTDQSDLASGPDAVPPGPTDLAPGPDGLIYAISRTSYAAINTKVKTSRPTPFTLPDRESSAVVGADGKHLYILGDSGSDEAIRVVDVGSREVVGTLAANLGAAANLAVSTDGQRIYVSNFYREGIIVLDGAGPKEIGMIEIGR
ncbi:caspase family protein [Kribbella sp. NPDC058245]|uniref:caspase, EACC1-associated type n=1 Tax=Kribbella sp. NPDC058245 TaxID=3346399 RepID=UPI0036E25BD0